MYATDRHWLIGVWSREKRVASAREEMWAWQAQALDRSIWANRLGPPDHILGLFGIGMEDDQIEDLKRSIDALRAWSAEAEDYLAGRRRVKVPRQPQYESDHSGLNPHFVSHIPYPHFEKERRCLPLTGSVRPIARLLRRLKRRKAALSRK